MTGGAVTGRYAQHQEQILQALKKYDDNRHTGVTVGLGNIWAECQPGCGVVRSTCAGAAGAGGPNRSSKEPPLAGAGPPLALLLPPPPPSMSSALGAAADCVTDSDIW